MSLTHFDEQGASRMVDVGDKSPTRRAARASARIRMAAATLRLIQDRALAKGDVLEIARIAGIQAAKRTWELIPLCHPLPLDQVKLDFTIIDPQTIQLEATTSVTARTGVEMEAMTAVTVAALTIYDMVKAVDRGLVIEQVQLEEKSGGRSGHYQRKPAGDVFKPQAGETTADLTTTTDRAADLGG
jgi:cyclic pyranopterin phosphate synthase